ncbi:MAG: acetate--CoA ligase [Candidatus Tectomicrobia bacterium]|uniref:Acetyl-coenzyme A synthetase n=1 Tax=Tectimicrobiota bacterium TaxID=2528274 RepID=A0A932HXH9_UNCTE|nr:acetate--CoA ligase [Candidatus Tectomicrobia bacterium]
MAQPTQNISTLLQENRVYKPPKEFSSQAHIKSMAAYRRLYEESIKSPAKFWGRHAEQFHWYKKWKKVLEWKEPHAQWFAGGTTNISYNCLDRHLATWRKNKAALVWEGEPGDSRVLTYQDLHREVSKFANAMKSLGIGKGDRVIIYLPQTPEAAIAMLACARIGAPHSVVFAGFSANSLRDRIQDTEAKAVITADGGWRRGNVVPLKLNADEAIEGCPSVKTVVVLKRTNTQVRFQEGRDHWWQDIMADASPDCPAEELDAEHPLYILYTSGTTGKPKGIVHTTGGYMVGTWLTTRCVFDVKDEDTFWCTADIGWVTGHSYIIYGPLLNGATSVMYEGAPNHPGPGRFWDIVQKYRVNIFYTAPTAIRAFMKWGEEHPKQRDLSSLRLLGTVGEPINPEAWMWYRRVIGGERCPIVDTWWQTETGTILITPLPGAIPTKPGTATLPFFGVVPDVVTKEGKSVGPEAGGFLVIRRPWPAMLRTLWRDDERYRKQYWGEIKGCYFTGDGARRDKDGYFWIMGRVDDVINVAGHRLGTMEIESALVANPRVAEAAVVGIPHELKGQGIAAFVTLKGANAKNVALEQELKDWVVKEIGAIARPDVLRFTDALPKTRSGKIMRRLLRDIASGSGQVGDTTTLEDISVLQSLQQYQDE